MEFDALLHFPMLKMAVQPGKEDNGLFASVYVVYDLNIGCPYGYQIVQEEDEKVLLPEPPTLAKPATITEPASVAAPAVVTDSAPLSPAPTQKRQPEPLAPEYRPHLIDAEAAALATLQYIDADFDSAPGSETASRLACMLQVYRSMSLSVLSRLGPMPSPPPRTMTMPSLRTPVMPPLMSLPVNLPNALLRQFSVPAQPKRKKKPHRGPRIPKYLQTQTNIPIWNYQ
jgi:hypothetical protein